jgi:histidyl-tRNA synthetase
VDGVAALLGAGRKDESGDFTKGAGLTAEQIARVMAFAVSSGDGDALANISGAVSGSEMGAEGAAELRAIVELLHNCGYGENRIRVDTGIVRGLDYYTGPVFEAQLTFPVTNEDGETVVFGSVAGGGRYDDLVARFTGQQVPATGISIGVSRLISALKERATYSEPLVVVLTVDKENVAGSFAMAHELRTAGIRAETYTGNKKFGDQLKYADKRGAAVAVIEGGDERAKGEVQLKDLALGSELAKTVESRADWVKDRPAQISVRRDALVAELRKMLARG